MDDLTLGVQVIQTLKNLRDKKKKHIKYIYISIFFNFQENINLGLIIKSDLALNDNYIITDHVGH